MYLNNLTKQDVKDFLYLCQEFHKESRLSDLPLDLTVCGEQLYKYMKSPEGFVEFNRNKEGKIVGVFVGAMVPLFFTKEKQAQDLVFYVLPEHRGDGWFFKISKQFEQWAKSHGASQVVIYHDTGIATEMAVPLMTKLNYEKTGYCFSKDIKCVD